MPIVQAMFNLFGQKLVNSAMDSAVKLILSYGGELGEKAKEYLEQVKNNESSKDAEVPQEVQAELKSSLKEGMKEKTQPAYMDGVALFCNEVLTEEEEERLELFLNCFNYDLDFDWSDIIDEREEKYFNIFKDFIEEWYGGCVNANEYDYVIDGDVIYLNFSDLVECIMYEPDKIRQFIYALNNLLCGSTYKRITKFTIY